MGLDQRSCVPCEGGTPPLSDGEADKLGVEVPEWFRHERTIERSWRMPDFAATLAFVNEVGALAESEGHHPDIHVTDYRKLRIVLTTHAIGGLSENDYILAAKIDKAWSAHE